MAGGGNGNEDRRRRRRRLQEENSENDENNDFDAAIEHYEDARELLQERISELETERDTRESALKKFSENLSVMWNEIMEPISCAEDGDESNDGILVESESNEEKDGASSTTEFLISERSNKSNQEKKKIRDNDSSFSTSSDDDDVEDNVSKRKRKRRIKKKKSNCGSRLLLDTSIEPSNSQNDPTPSTSHNNEPSSSKEKKTYRKSLSRIMFEWARDQKEFKDEMVQLREEKFRDNDDIEKFAFFKMFEKKNEEQKEKLTQESKRRSIELQRLKEKKKKQLKSKFKEELRSWLSNEKSTRLKQDKRRRKLEYIRLRKLYLGDCADVIYEDKESAISDIVQPSPIPCQLTDNVTDEHTTRNKEVIETQQRETEESKTPVPSKRAKTLR